MQSRLEKGRERLDGALEALAMLCEPVQPPKNELDYIHYFCGNTEIPEELKTTELQRMTLYKSVAALVRAYAGISDDLPQAGYSQADIDDIKCDVNNYVKLRDLIRHASGETIDLKAYEADMRHLIDTYIEASESRIISEFGETGLLDLIVKSGIAEAINSLPQGIKNSHEAIAETIANNVRRKIMKDHLSDPAFYDTMSVLLTDILHDLREKRIEYEKFLAEIADLAKRVQTGTAADMPSDLNTAGKRALFNNLGNNKTLALKLDETVRVVKPHGWRGNVIKERAIKSALLPLLDNNAEEVERIFSIISLQEEYW